MPFCYLSVRPLRLSSTPSEKAMATHSRTLAWEIPWTEEPGKLRSLGSLRVGHDWATSLSRIGEGNGNPLQCSCLENPRDGGAWWVGDLWLYGSVGSHRVWHDWSDLAAAAASNFSYENFLISWGGINLSILCAFGIFDLCISYSIPASYSINVPSCSFFHFFVSVCSLKIVTISSVVFTCRYLINLVCFLF